MFNNLLRAAHKHRSLVVVVGQAHIPGLAGYLILDAMERASWLEREEEEDWRGTERLLSLSLSFFNFLPLLPLPCGKQNEEFSCPCDARSIEPKMVSGGRLLSLSLF